MLILNFSHPLTDEQKEQIEKISGQKIGEIRHIPTNFDNDKPFEPQVEELIRSCNLTSEEWQTLPILIVPPALNFIAVTLLAAIHGIMGYFPPIVRIKPVENTIPPRFEVAEIIDLKKIREKYRSIR
ncbi:MAG: hypothetical protein DRQ06_04200 [Candidatus Hydrothermota bacterium]|nr:MAG: hypothetical protein DRQ06_04200 [Candidatus Hydrothermae bacterium]